MKKLLLFCAALAIQAQTVQVRCGSATDQYFVGGTAFRDATLGPPPFDTLRYGSRFSYKLPATPGAYLIRVYFVEPNATAAGRRVFTVSVNGQASDAIDLFQDGGAHAQRIIETSAVSYWGFVRLDFVATIGNAVATMIEILPLSR